MHNSNIFRITVISVKHWVLNLVQFFCRCFKWIHMVFFSISLKNPVFQVSFQKLSNKRLLKVVFPISTSLIFLPFFLSSRPTLIWKNFVNPKKLNVAVVSNQYKKIFSDLCVVNHFESELLIYKCTILTEHNTM